MNFFILLLSLILGPALDLHGSARVFEELKFLKACVTGNITKVEQCLSRKSDHEINAALLLAAEKGLYAIMPTLLKHGPDINTKTAEGNAPVHYAAEYGHSSCLELLITHGADVNLKNNAGETPLMVACQHDQRKAAETLVAYGDVNLPMCCGVTPLHYASQVGLYWWVAFLLEHDADVILSTENNQTALSLACKYFHAHVAQLLLDNGASLEYHNKQGENLFLQSIGTRKKGRYATAVFLIGEGVAWDEPDSSGSTALHRACKDGDISLVNLLLTQGAKPYREDDAERTPLSYAVEQNHALIVKRFLELPEHYNLRGYLAQACGLGYINSAEMFLNKGISIDEEDDAAVTPLLAACAVRNIFVIRMLLRRNVDINRPNKKGITALIFAILQNNHDLVKLFIEHHADVNLASNSGTPLEASCMRGYGPIARSLLQAGAYVDSVDNYGNTPLMLSCGRKNRAIARILIEHNANVNMRNSLNQTALFLSSVTGAVDCVQLLLSHGADLTLKNIEGISPLVCASICGFSTIVDLLIQHGADPDERGPNGITPLMLAAGSGRLKVVTLLIDTHKASVAAESSKGLTPLTCALFYERAAVVAELKKRGAVLGEHSVFQDPNLVPALLLDRNAKETGCTFCREVATLVPCNFCHSAYYCDVQCQEADRHSHSTICSQ